MSTLTRRDWVVSLAAGLGGVACQRVAPGPAPGPRPPASSPTREELALIAGCRGALVGHTQITDGAELARIGAWCTARGATADLYGGGGLVEELETRVATLLGYPAACLMPTGTMGQLALLRLYADRAGARGLAVHPSSHHLLHEDAAFQVLHGMHEVVIAPWGRAIRGDDIRRVQEPLAAVSVELPVRWTGALQTWAELEDVKAACRERNVPLHLDGARLWECGPAYDRPLAEICAGAESTYVSLYKTLGALGGAIVAGNRELIDGARLWRHRHGGNLATFFPYAASALMRLDDTLARIPTWVARAQRLATRLAQDPRIVVAPTAPATNLFHLYLRGDPDALRARRDAIAAERKVFVCHGFGRARVPGYVDIELQPGAASDALTDAECADAVLALLA